MSTAWASAFRRRVYIWGPGQGCGLRSLSAAELYESVAAVIRDGKAMDYLYSIGQMK